jgi:hypothetical protein
MTTADLRPPEYNIHEVAGADLSLVITCYEEDGTTPIDVSTYTFAADVLRAGAVVDSFAAVVSGDDDNILTLTLTDTETAAIGTGRGLEWALKVTVAGVTDWWYAGNFQLYNAGTPRERSSSNELTAVVGGSITASLTAGVPANDAAIAGLINDPASDTTAALAAQYAPLVTEQPLTILGPAISGGTTGSAAFNNNGLGTNGERYPGWLLDATSFENVRAQFRVPDGWTSVDFDFIWGHTSAGSGVVRFRCDVESSAAGDVANGSDIGASVDVTAGSQNQLLVSRIRSSVAVTPGTFVSVGIARRAQDAEDTLASDIVLIGVMVGKA